MLSLLQTDFIIVSWYLNCDIGSPAAGVSNSYKSSETGELL